MYAIFMVINYKNFLNFIYKLYSFIIYMNKKVFVIDFNNIEKIYTNKIRWIYAWWDTFPHWAARLITT